ncbi:MAG: efflux RND transporter periplasmic adaptor subunit [Candidatus Brocadiaceae bacterium]
MNRTWLALGLTVGLVLASWAQNAPAQQGASPNTIVVEAFTAPFRDLEIASEVGGVLRAVEVEEGERVEAGQVIARLKAETLEAQLAVSEARVDAAELEIQSARKNYEDLEREWRDVKELAEKGIEPVEKQEKARLEMELGKLSLERAQVQKRVVQLNADRDRAALARTIIRAPCDGEILRIAKRPGEAVEPLGPVARLVSLNPLYVIAQAVPIQTMGHVLVGEKAALTLEDLPDRRLECTVAVVDKVADPASGTYRVKLTLPNPDESLPSGARGKLAFRVDRQP